MIEPKKITFSTPPNHISPFLTHWTGRSTKSSPDESFGIISKIIKTQKLKLSPCPIGFSNIDCIQLGVPMTCFTETPLEHSVDHCKHFGKFGIGFDKQDMIKLGANPVLYIVSRRKYYQDTFRDIYWHKLQELKEVPKNQTSIPFEIRNNLSWFLSSSQPHTDTIRGKEREYYPQREWRIIRNMPYGITNAEIKQWGPINDGFDMSEITCEQEERTYCNGPINVTIGWLAFNKLSIKSIIVPEDYKEQAEILRKEENLVDCDIFLLESD